MNYKAVFPIPTKYSDIYRVELREMKSSKEGLGVKIVGISTE